MATPPTPAQVELATRLRRLREQHWADVRITQAVLASVLADGEGLSAATVSSWESLTSPKLPPPERLYEYARFFSTRRSVEAGEHVLIPLDEMTAEEAAVCKALEGELLGLRDKIVKPALKSEPPPRKSWLFFDSGPLNIVCSQLPEDELGSLADPALPNYTELMSYADLDSLVELHGHIRAENPKMHVYFKASTKVVTDDLSGHVVQLGGIAWNEITEILSEMTVLPVRQIRDPEVETGEIFVVGPEGEEQRFLPVWRDEKKTKLKWDVGLLARTPNPINSSRTLTICNGVHSRGVLGAVRTLTDERLRDSNERYLARNFGNSSSFAILMRVAVIEGNAMTPDFNTPGCVLYQWSGDYSG